MQQLCARLNIDKRRTSGYHPQTNGLTERFNKTLSDMLSCFVNQKHDDWHEFLPMVTFAYNSSVQDSTGYSPSLLFFGREAVFPCDVDMLAKSLLPSAQEHDMPEIFDQVIRNQRNRNERNIRQYDKRHGDHAFEVGDMIFVRDKTVSTQHRNKFAPK